MVRTATVPNLPAWIGAAPNEQQIYAISAPLQKAHYLGAPPPSGALLVSVVASTGATVGTTMIGSYDGAAIVDSATSTLYAGTSSPDRLVAFRLSASSTVAPRLEWSARIGFSPLATALVGNGQSGIMLAGSDQQGPVVLQVDADNHTLTTVAKMPCTPDSMAALGNASLVVTCQGPDAAWSGSIVRVPFRRCVGLLPR